MKEQDKRLQDLGVQISIYRKQKKMTQAQLAVEIGISRTHMSNIEALNMPTQISVDTLFKIADVLGIKVSNFQADGGCMYGKVYDGAGCWNNQQPLYSF